MGEINLFALLLELIIEVVQKNKSKAKANVI